MVSNEEVKTEEPAKKPRHSKKENDENGDDPLENEEGAEEEKKEGEVATGEAPAESLENPYVDQKRLYVMNLSF